VGGVQLLRAELGRLQPDLQEREVLQEPGPEGPGLLDPEEHSFIMRCSSPPPPPLHGAELHHETLLKDLLILLSMEQSLIMRRSSKTSSSSSPWSRASS